MKRNLLFGALIMLTSAVSAQSFALYHEDTELTDGAEYTVHKLSAVEETGSTDPDMQCWTYSLEAELKLKNTTASSVDFSMTMTLGNQVTGSFMYCVKSCTFISSGSNTQIDRVDAGSYYGGLHIAFNPVIGTYESVRAAVTATDLSTNASKTVYINFVYDAASSNKAALTDKCRLYQNGSALVLNSSLKDAVVTINNITGKQVGSYSVEGNAVIENNLPKGIYIYTVTSEGQKIASNKIVIR